MPENQKTLEERITALEKEVQELRKPIDPEKFAASVKEQLIHLSQTKVQVSA